MRFSWLDNRPIDHHGALLEVKSSDSPAAARSGLWRLKYGTTPMLIHIRKLYRRGIQEGLVAHLVVVLLKLFVT